MYLDRFFQENPKAALAFSGGVDSAYLLYTAKKAGAAVTAYYVRTPLQPQFEYEDALRLARELEMPMRTLSVPILDNPQIVANPENRCYFCKKQLFSAIRTASVQDGFHLILDGTNASDDVADRPGMAALQELQVRSPLREAGLTKAEIRRLSREAGLFTHDKPAYACLATRIPAGVPITREALSRTENAENYLKGLGFSDFRIRLSGDAARIQLPESQIPLLLEHRQAILAHLKTCYRAVLLDLEVRHHE